jgi:hypothetical protein
LGVCLNERKIIDGRRVETQFKGWSDLCQGWRKGFTKKSHNLLFKDKEYALEKEEEMGEIIFLALGQLKGLAQGSANFRTRSANDP